MEKRGFTLYKRIAGVLIFSEIISLLLLITGYTTAVNVMNSGHPQGYIDNYKIFCIVAMVVVIGIFTLIGVSVLSNLRKGFKEANETAKRLSVGDTDIEFNITGNDEFAVLLTQVKALVEATKKQSQIAEAVADGNLTIDVDIRSDKDTLGLALKKMVDRNLNSLSNIQRKIVKMLAIGYEKKEIQNVLSITKRVFEENIKIIKCYENVRILQKYEEEE